jgi:hypothetical protein
VKEAVRPSTRTAKGRTATIWGTPRSTADGEVDQYRGTDRKANPTESDHTHQTKRAEIRELLMETSSVGPCTSLH